jgi:hypothetical protein
MKKDVIHMVYRENITFSPDPQKGCYSFNDPYRREPVYLCCKALKGWYESITSFKKRVTCEDCLKKLGLDRGKRL